MSTITTFEPNSLADRVAKLLAGKKPGTEFDDEDLAFQFKVTRAAVVKALEPYVGPKLLQRRTAGSLSHWRLGPAANAGTLTALNGHLNTLASMQAAAGPPPAPPVARKAAKSIEPPDLAALKPVAYSEVPEVKRKGSIYRAALDKLGKPGLCLQGLDARWYAGFNGAIGDRHKDSLQRYAVRKMPDGTLSIYRLADAKPDAVAKPAAKKSATK